MTYQLRRFHCLEIQTITFRISQIVISGMFTLTYSILFILVTCHLSWTLICFRLRLPLIATIGWFRASHAPRPDASRGDRFTSRINPVFIIWDILRAFSPINVLGNNAVLRLDHTSIVVNPYHRSNSKSLIRVENSFCRNNSKLLGLFNLSQEQVVEFVGNFQHPDSQDDYVLRL